MRRSCILSLAAVLGACAPVLSDPEPEPQPGDEPRPDERPAGATLVFDVDHYDPVAALGLGLIAQDAPSVWPVEYRATAPVEELQARLELPPPERAALVRLEDGTEGLLLRAFVFQDFDGDGEQNAREMLRGAGPGGALWLEDPGAAWRASGFVAGWNAVDLEGGSPLPVDVGLARVNLMPRWYLMLAGSLRTAHDRIAVQPWPLPEEPVSLGFDIEAPSYWTHHLEQAPGPDHGVDDPDLGPLAVRVPLAYMDTDGSGGLTAADRDLHGPCLGDQPVAALFVSPPLEPARAWALASSGARPGWSVIRLDVLESEGRVEALDVNGLREADIEAGCGER